MSARVVEPARVMFTYWGRRSALSRFTLEVAPAALFSLVTPTSDRHSFLLAPLEQMPGHSCRLGESPCCDIVSPNGCTAIAFRQ